MPYPDLPRCCHTGKEEVVSRFTEYASRWGYSGTCDRIRFTVNRRIFIVGFGLYGSIHGPTDYRVNIQIIHSETSTVSGQNETGFSCDGTWKTFRVMFKEPIEIMQNQFYTASATLIVIYLASGHSANVCFLGSGQLLRDKGSRSSPPQRHWR